MYGATPMAQSWPMHCRSPGHLFQRGVSPARLRPPWSFPAADRASSLTLLAQPDRSRSPRLSLPRPRGWGPGAEQERLKGCRARGRGPLTAARHHNSADAAGGDRRRLRALGCGGTAAEPGTSCLERRTGRRTGRRGGSQVGTRGRGRGSRSGWSRPAVGAEGPGRRALPGG